MYLGSSSRIKGCHYDYPRVIQDFFSEEQITCFFYAIQLERLDLARLFMRNRDDIHALIGIGQISAAQYAAHYGSLSARNFIFELLSKSLQKNTT